MKLQGIYQIRNKISNKVYIGQVCSRKGAARRWIEHKSSLRKGKHYNPHLQAAWCKYGEDNFIFEMVENVVDERQLDEREQHWINQTILNQYNIQKIAGGSPLGMTKKLTEVAKRNIAAANKNRAWTEEDRRRQSRVLTGIKRDMRFRKRRQEIMTGSRLSAETRAKIGAGNKGKIVSIATRQKMALRQLGRIKSLEEIEKTQAARRSKSGKNCFKGVCKRNNLWEAKFRHDKTTYRLGYFASAEEAAQNYDFHVLKKFGKDVYLNFPNKDYSLFCPKKQF